MPPPTEYAGQNAPAQKERKTRVRVPASGTLIPAEGTTPPGMVPTIADVEGPKPASRRPAQLAFESVLDPADRVVQPGAVSTSERPIIIVSSGDESEGQGDSQPVHEDRQDTGLQKATGASGTGGGRGGKEPPAAGERPDGDDQGDDKGKNGKRNGEERVPKDKQAEGMVEIPHATCDGSGCIDCAGRGVLSFTQKDMEVIQRKNGIQTPTVNSENDQPSGREIFTPDSIRKKSHETQSLPQWQKVQAGSVVEKVRQDNRISARRLGALAGVDKETLRRFERGEHQRLDLDRAYKGLVKLGVDPQVIRNREGMQTLETASREQIWLHTLAPASVTLGMSIDNLRLVEGETEPMSAARVGCTVNKINEYVDDTTTPSSHRLHEILSAYNIEPYSKLGQLFHLKREKMEPEFIMDFVQLSFGEQLHIYRTLLGYSAGELGQKMHYSADEVERFEANKRTSTIAETSFNNLAAELGLSEDSALLRIMKERAKGLPVTLTDKEYREILNGHILFRDHLPTIELSSGVKPEEVAIDQHIRHWNDTNNVLTQLMAKKDVKIADLDISDQEKDQAREMFKRMRSKNVVPLNRKLVEFLDKVGFGFHHPVTQYVLECARAERRLSHADRRLFQTLVQMKDSGMEAGKLLAFVRNEKGVSELDISKNADIRRSLVVLIESGEQTPRRNRIERIMSSLGYDPESAIVSFIKQQAYEEYNRKHPTCSRGEWNNITE